MEKQKRYKIIIKQDYPASSPKVESQTGPESLFLLSNWNHNFTFCDIIDQLVALQNIPPTQVFKVNKEEISLALKESNYADTQNPDSRLKIIKNTSTIQHAQSILNQSERKKDELDKKIDGYNQDIFVQNDKLDALLRKKREYMDVVSSSSNPSIGVKNKIASLEKENADHEKMIKKLSENVSSGKIDATQYAIDLFKEKHAILKNQALIDSLKTII